MVCRKCNSTRVKFWNGWELCDNCGYRYHTETKISPDDITCDKCERRNQSEKCPNCGGDPIQKVGINKHCEYCDFYW